MDPNFKADVVFLVDSSFSVSRPNFQLEKDFVKSMGDTLNVEPGKSRGSVVSFATTPRRHFGFNDYSTKSQFERLVDSTPYLGQYRRMDKAIEEAGRVLKQARDGVPKVVVLLTAGRDVRGGEVLKEAVKPLQRDGVKVFIVAIGDQPDIPALTGAVEQPEDVFRVPGFKQLPDHGVPAGNHVASRAGKERVDFFLSGIVVLTEMTRCGLLTKKRVLVLFRSG